MKKSLLILLTLLTVTTWAQAQTYPPLQKVRWTSRTVAPVVPYPTIQQPQPLPMPLPPTSLTGSPRCAVFAQVDAAIKSQRTSIGLHNDQLNLSGTRAIGEFGVTLVDPARWKLRYSVTTQTGQSETFSPTGALTIGSTEFVKADTKPADIKPVQIDWTVGPTHRLELTCLRFRTSEFWVNPSAIMEWSNVSITATRNDDGKVIRDSEAFNAFRYGIGAEAVYDYGNSRCRVAGYASDKYLLGEFTYRWAIAQGLDCQFGYSAKDVKLERDSTLRTQGFSLGLNFLF